jgi:hypothetical protein
MNAPLVMTPSVQRAPALHVTLPQRAMLASKSGVASPPTSFQVLRTNRVPQQLSLFERPPGVR